MTSRRAFLQAGSLGFLGVNLPQLLRAAGTQPLNGKAQSVILLWLEGGPSQIDTWDPKPSSAFKAISTNVAGIQVAELLPQDTIFLAEIIDHQELAVVHPPGNGKQHKPEWVENSQRWQTPLSPARTLGP